MVCTIWAFFALIKAAGQKANHGVGESGAESSYDLWIGKRLLLAAVRLKKAIFHGGRVIGS